MESSDNKLSDLNHTQRRAVVHRGSHLLIAAGPGTGKTHTLTYRIAHIVKEINAPQNTLAVTFTNKAANEMRQRLKSRLGEISKEITVGTFHSFCLQILQQYIQMTDLPGDFKVATPQEIGPLIKELWKDETKSGRKEILDEISLWKSSISTDEIPEGALRYNRILRENNLLDFDDLLCETLKLLKSSEEVLCEIQNKYRFIFVDEYQDINEVQQALLKILVGENVHITVIGDPNQAIYGFRGSDIRFFESFKDDFPDATILSLDENYRSASNLLAASGQVISRSGLSYMPNLTARMYKEGRLTIYGAPTDKAEAEYVVHQIEKMVGGTSMFSQDSGRVDSNLEAERTFGDIAVLYRLKRQRKLLQEAFSRSGIPCEECLDTINTPEGLDDKLKEKAEYVHFLTLHASKGLEFPVVFIVGCEEGILPLDIEGLDSSINEERRLFYVGMTRAKERLYLIRAKRRHLYGKAYKNSPSSFLLDIEESLKAYDEVQQKKNVRKKREKQQLSLFG